MYTMKQTEESMIKELKEKYNPEQVLVVYKSEGDDAGNYIEIHPVKKGKIMEGRPLKKKTLHDLLKECGDTTDKKLSFREIINENILYYNCNAYAPILIWFEPACFRPLLFEKEISSGIAAIPPLVFCYRNEDLFVFVSEEKKELKPDSYLHYLPLPNIYDSGSVCMGNVDMEIDKEINYVEDIMELCSQKFWKSTFTDFHLKTPLKDRNVYEFWNDHIKRKVANFPKEVLQESKVTLKKLWKE